MAALHGAVTFTQVHGMTGTVRQDLNLDVARVIQEFFHVDGGIVESGTGLGAGQVDRV